ncbi:hypothetical protein QQ045_031692 [Rhodiola kirilowii]
MNAQCRGNTNYWKDVEPSSSQKPGKIQDKKSYIEDFESNNNKWRNHMKQLAKMDFNIVQLQHQNETQLFNEWWDNKGGLSEEMKRARNQPLKWYLWLMGILADPSRSEQRIVITKPISLVYTINDDVYGTLEEVVLFTKVVNR